MLKLRYGGEQTINWKQARYKSVKNPTLGLAQGSVFAEGPAEDCYGRDGEDESARGRLGGREGCTWYFRPFMNVPKAADADIK